ncbi:MAG TPA: GAF domain-containing protein [Acidimicrobiales bacterium]|nr:GAF domain-containing protein [Acidimicrobiales bacterium]
MTGSEPQPLSLAGLQQCFEGAVPAVVATAAADGTPNITYLSRVQLVDAERIALSNQFFSKTARNLAENPRASVLLIDPTTYRQFRLAAVYERTERRGPVFDRLRRDVDALATLAGLQDVFKLRAADVYRVVDVEEVPSGRAVEPQGEPVSPAELDAATSARLGDLVGRLSRCGDLDTLVEATVHGLAELFGYEHCVLLLTDEAGRQLYTIASHGFATEGVGSEVPLGQGIIGMAAARCEPLRLGNLRQMAKYSSAVRRSFDEGAIGPGADIPLPALPEAQSRVAVPAMSRGQLVGVLTVESDRPVAFTPADEAVLTVVASVVANAVELERTQAPAGPGGDDGAPTPQPAEATSDDAMQVRFYEADGSTFLDGDYLIKGVAGRLLWSLLRQHEADGRTEFTNREVRLDSSLDLPAFRDNLESRLILLKRRLDEREAPVRIEKTGRGRFRLLVEGALRLEAVSA